MEESGNGEIILFQQTISLAPLLGPIVTDTVIAVGWPAVHYLNQRRDRANKRHDLIAQYLLEAYRRLETAAHRPDRTDEQLTAFESAVADIQLLGSDKQISTTNEYMKIQASSANANVAGILCALRNDLRRGLGLSRIERPPAIFRFTRGPKESSAGQPQ